MSSLLFSRSWAKRNGFSDTALVGIWVIVAFVLFQLVGTIAAIVLVFTTADGPLTDPNYIMQLLTERIDLMLVGNTLGQFLVIAGMTYLWANLHTHRKWKKQFFRLQAGENTLKYTIAGVLFIIVAQPALMLLAKWNSYLPQPEFLKEQEEMMMKMLESFLTGDTSIFFIIFNVAVVPAICEELMFRGYVFRTFEQKYSVTAAIIISSLIFGLFHLRLTQLVVLSGIGAVLAIVAWRSGSIYPAMVLHLVNNSMAAIVAKFFPEFSDLNEDWLPPVYIIALSFVLGGVLLYYMFKILPKTEEKEPQQLDEIEL